MKQNGPWTIKESIEKYKNKWITVTEHQVIRPDGKDGIFGVVEMLTGVSVLPFDNQGNVYLTKEYKFAVEKETLESISGGIDEMEEPLIAAKRELLEETGLTASKWTFLGEIHPFTSVVHSPSHLFIAEEIRDTGKSELEGTEILDIIKMPFSEAVSKVMNGEIIHGPTCVLILKANEYLKQKSA